MSRRSGTSLATVFALAVMAACSDSTEPRGPGSIFVTSSADLPEPGNYFTYGISVDDGTPRMASPFENVTFIVNGLAHGAHTVELTDMPTTCNAGTNVRDVNLRGDDTALVAFRITCARTTGDLRVVVTTTGPDQDADGYVITANGSSAGPIPANGQVTFPFVTPATYTIGLTGVAGNCAASPPQNVTITAGVLSTVSFTVTCTQSAVVRVVSSATGSDVDPDGIIVRVGTASPTRFPHGTGYMRVPTGTMTYEFTDVQANCTLAGAASGSVTTAAGDTTTLTATATCASVGYGVAGTAVADPLGDTLSNTSDPDRAHDVVNVSTRYAPGFMILVLRFAQPVGSVGTANPAGLQGWVELDVDESTATGVSPAINFFGGSASQGVDYALVLWEGSATSVLLESVTADTTTHRVPMALEGDSIVFRIPLAKLAGDDGRMSITMVAGDYDRPTDIAPNSGVILARPSGALREGDVIAGARAKVRAPPLRRDVTWAPSRPAVTPLRGTPPRSAPPNR